MIYLEKHGEHSNQGNVFCGIYPCRLQQVVKKLYKITGFTIFQGLGGGLVGNIQIRGTFFLAFIRIYPCRLQQVVMKLYKITGFTILQELGGGLVGNIQIRGTFLWHLYVQITTGGYETI